MASTCEASIAELERSLEQASADLAKVKRTAGIVTGIVLGGGVVYIVWRLFAARAAEASTDGS